MGYFFINFFKIGVGIKTQICLFRSGLNKQKAALVGLPRFDFYVKSSNNNNKQIVLFSFIIEDYLDQEIINLAKDKFHSISDLFQINVMRFALIHPDYKVAIKTRDAERYLNYPKKLYGKHIGKKIPKNLSIINRAYPEHLILNSKVIEQLIFQN